MDVLLSVQQVANILGMSESTVRRMEEKGDLRADGEGQYRFDLGCVLFLRSERTKLRSKMTISGVKASDLKEIVDRLDESARVTIVLEEFDPPGEVASKHHLSSWARGFTSMSIYGNKHAKTWVVGAG